MLTYLHFDYVFLKNTMMLANTVKCIFKAMILCLINVKLNCINP